MLEIVKKSPGFGEPESSNPLSSSEVETAESLEGDVTGKVKENKKQDEQILEEEIETNGQIGQDSSTGYKFLLEYEYEYDEYANTVITG